MNEKEEKREFTQKLKQIAKNLAAEIEDKKGKVFILLGADSDEEVDDSQFVIAASGKRQQVIEVLAQFISHPQAKPLLVKAVRLVMAKRLSGNLKKLTKHWQRVSKQTFN